MKKVIRPSRLVVVGGRFISFLTILGIVFSLCGGYIAWTYLLHESSAKAIVIIIGGLSLVVLGIQTLSYYWQPYWGKLILTEDAITWRCLFCKPITIPYNEMCYVEVRAFTTGNALYRPGCNEGDFLHLLLSSHPLPQKRIDKIRSGKDLIKFHYTPEVAATLCEAIPRPWNEKFKKLV